MNSMIKDAMLVSIIGVTGFCAYKMMPASKRKRLNRDARRTMEDACDVREDMMHMANTIKNEF